MSETKFLYGAAVQGIQGFIFQTNKLREIVGASELVEEICTDKFIDVFTQLGLKYDPNNCIVHAAGNIKYVFDNEDECNIIVKYFPKFVSSFAPGVTISQAVVRHQGKFEDDVDELERLLHAQRNKPMRSATLGLMGVERSRQTGLPVVLVKNENRFGQKEELHLDAGSRAKLYMDPNGERKKTTLSLCNKAFVSHDDFERGVRIKEEQVAFDIEDITGNNDWIAIIHADGNGLGQVVQEIGKNEVEFKQFSENLDRATTEAAYEAYIFVSDNHPMTKNGKIPIRPIVLGGDDLTVICRADIALDFTYKFILEFERKTRCYLGDTIKKHNLFGLGKVNDCLTACAGIAYIKSSFPFYYGYDLAETLCDIAKKDAKDSDNIKRGKELPMSCLMFHKIQDSFTEDWNSIAKRELTPQPNISFEFGPYYLEDKQGRWTVLDLINNTKDFDGEDGNAVKSHLRNWMSMLHDNPAMAEQKLERLKSMTSMFQFVDAITKGKKRGDVIVYPVYDMLAIHTINTQITKEEK